MQDLDDRLVQEYPWDAYLANPPSLQRKLEALLLLEIADLLRSEKRLTSSWRGCQQLLERDPTLRATLVKCWAIGSFQQIRDSDVLGQIGVSIADLDATAKNVEIYGGSFTSIQAQQVNQTVNITADEESKQRKIMDWLTTIDYHVIQKDMIAKRVEDTGSWFLKGPQFLAWMKYSAEKCQFLWCPGMPGAGKTMISSIVVDHLQQSGHIACIVYFNYKRQLEQSLSHIIASILRQLCQCHPVALKKLIKIHKKSPDMPSSEPALFATLEDILDELPTIYVVLDALDEYLGKSSDRELNSLLDSCRKLKTAKFMFTSRILGRMEAIFRQVSAFRQDIVGDDLDICQYLDYRVKQEIPFAQKLTRDLIIPKISGLSHQSFLLAQLHMNTLAQQDTIGEVRDAVERLSGGIDQAYEETWRRINEQDQRRTAMAHEILLWVTCTLRNLSIDELQHALAMVPGRKDIEDYLLPADTITAVCAGLIVVDENSSSVRFIHSTAQSFFMERRILEWPKAEVTISKTSLDYFSLASTHGVIPPPERYIQYPFCNYILEYWTSHLRQCQDEMKSQLEDFSIEPTGRTFFCAQALRNGLAKRFGISPESQPTPNELHFAAMFDLPFVLEHCIQRGASVNSREPATGCTPLLLAAEIGAHEVVDILLSQPDIEPDLEDALGRTPLAIAIQNRHMKAAALLVQNPKVDVNRRDESEHGWTLLSKAITRHRTDAFELLLECDRTDYKSKDNEGRTPLTLAVQYGNEDIAQLLAEKDVYDLSFRDRENDRGLLSWSAKRGLVSCLRDLATQIHSTGGSLEEKDVFGRTALSYAASSGDPSLIGALLHPFGGVSLSTGLSVGINSQDNVGRTPLWHAVDSLMCSPSTVGSLECSPSTVDLLLSLGAQADFTDRSGWSPWTLAIRHGKEDTVEVLAKVCSYDFSFRSGDGRTLLSWAAQKGLVNVVTEILKVATQRTGEESTCSNDAEQDTGAGEESVHQQARSSYLDTPDIFGRTPLSYAAQRGHADIVELLLAHGANPCSTDLHGRTPSVYVKETTAPPVGHGLRELPESRENRTARLLREAAASKEISSDPDKPNSTGHLARFFIKDNIKVYNLQTVEEPRFPDDCFDKIKPSAVVVVDPSSDSSDELGFGGP